MAASITDFSQFTALRAAADRKDPAALREVASQFEALFIKTMFKNMRETSLGDPIFGQSDQHEMYQDMLDQQYAAEMSSGRGIGLAEMLVRQLGGEDAKIQVAPPGNRPPPVSRVSYVRARPAYTGPAISPAEKTDDVSPQPEPSTVSRVDNVRTAPVWTGPVEFAKAIWSHAEKAAERLNIPPVALVAQAALETGWGKHVMQRPDGSSSFNLFGIKANRNWSGDSVAKPTIEFRDGVAEKRLERFRTYNDFADTFDDYVDLIGGHPRYAAVRDSGSDSSGFAQALQVAGYATDPDYAKKITNIIGSATMREAIHALKESVTQSINSKLIQDVLR